MHLLSQTAWTFLNDQSQPNDSYTYLELDRITTAMASWLLEESNIHAGDRVLLVFFPGLHFMISLVV
jgi:acyl-CoA synthetase (AMP-forming)/AMP-acid ligase II